MMRMRIFKSKTDVMLLLWEVRIVLLVYYRVQPPISHNIVMLLAVGISVVLATCSSCIWFAGKMQHHKIQSPNHLADCHGTQCC